MKKAAADNPNASVLVQVIAFSNGASWLGTRPTPLEYFQWPELTATVHGRTDLGAALTLLCREMRAESMPARALPPVLVLCTDGLPTDDYRKELAELLELPWGAKAVRIGIGIGKDADHETLRQFIANPHLQPLTARNAHDLVMYLRWASTSALQSASCAHVSAAPGAGPLRPPADPTIYSGAT